MDPDLRLIPREPIYLEHPGYEAGDAEWFAELFRQTWLRLPVEVRTQLLQHWGKIHPDFAPRVFFRKHLLHDAETPVGITSQHGNQIDFAGPAFLNWHNEEELIRAAIAHELAHVCFFAEADPDHGQVAGDTRSQPEIRFAQECKAIRRASSWGFDQAQLVALFYCGWPKDKVHELLVLAGGERADYAGDQVSEAD